MAAAEHDRSTDMPPTGQTRAIWPTRWRWRIALSLLVLVCVAIVITWLSRERIAGNLIEEQLDQNGLDAAYEIVEIGPRRQVIENLVIGDRDSPDLTAERLVVVIEYGFIGAGISRVEVSGVRVFGRYQDGVVSFGTLDSLLFAETDEPAGLPDFDVRLVDARGRVETDFGTIGIKIDGEGQLSNGFAGKIAATAPRLGVDGCRAGSVTFYGDLTTPGGVPRFSGPVRLRGANCYGATVSSADIAADLALDTSFAALDGNFDLVASQVGGFEVSGESVSGTADLTWREGTLTFQHDLVVDAVGTPYGTLQRLTADGVLRSAGDPARSEWSARIDGDGAALPLGESSVLSDAQAVAEGTLVASLLAKFERNFASVVTGGRLTADITVRQSEDGMMFVVPEARFRTSSDETLVALSRFSWAAGGRFSANLSTGGEGLPRISGRMEQVGGGELALRLRMEEYSAGLDRLAVPQLLVRVGPNGDLMFDGVVAAGGAIPGGSIEGLVMPLQGRMSSAGEVMIGEQCIRLRFARARYYDLQLDGTTLPICPSSGRSLASFGREFDLAAQTRALAVSGELSGSALALVSEQAEISLTGGFALHNLAATIGREGEAVRLTAVQVNGGFDDVIAGRIEGGTARLDVVPLDLDQVAGAWRYDGDVLLIEEGSFRLTERTEGDALARFEPLFARGATLTLDGFDLAANSSLWEPQSDQLITGVDIGHNLETGAGQAILSIPGIRFDDTLQPDDLTYLAGGVIAETAGTIAGEGRVDWTLEDLTSTGTFTTERFDFAAGFGLVSSLRGTMRFADLLAMTTEPGQVLEVGSVNPGIEVLGGRVVYDLRDGQVLNVEDARWPFMGGELILRPVTLDYGEPGGVRYVFELVGLDAATFVTQMELTNLGATGTFDGTIPVVFDTIGNGRIEGGLLISRPPGGNVAYVGDLTYEDLGAMANYAFQSLRSLDYTQMSVGLNGDLAGEIITNFQFDGISQGEGTSQNFVTRQLAKLPIRFKVNVRSENFYELSTVVRSFFDPEFLGNPVDRGLFEMRNGVLVPRNPSPAPPPPTPTPPADDFEATRPDESAVQPPESEEMQ